MAKIFARGYSYSCHCFVYGQLLPPDIKVLPRIYVTGAHAYYVDPSTVEVFVGYDADERENLYAACNDKNQKRGYFEV